MFIFRMVKRSDNRSSIISLYQNSIPAREICRRLKVCKSVVYRTIERYNELGSTNDRKGRGRPRTVVTTGNIKKVRERVRRNANRSVRKMSKEMGISRSSLSRIVKDHLLLTAYKKNTGQMLTDSTKVKRKERCLKLLKRFHGYRYREILFTDEKIFTVEEKLNKQNDRVYAISHPNVIVSRTSHPLSVMVFAGITASGKTPLLFVPQGVKVNSKNYMDLLKKEILPWAKSHFGSTPWTYQQDGAPAHKARNVQNWCARNFPDFIAFNEWPPSSPDCNPMDFSVWSVLEAKACSKAHKTIDSLKNALKKAWDDIDVDYLRATVDSFPKRLKACVAAEGGRFEI